MPRLLADKVWSQMEDDWDSHRPANAREAYATLTARGEVDIRFVPAISAFYLELAERAYADGFRLVSTSARVNGWRSVRYSLTPALTVEKAYEELIANGEVNLAEVPGETLGRFFGELRERAKSEGLQIEMTWTTYDHPYAQVVGEGV